MQIAINIDTVSTDIDNGIKIRPLDYSKLFTVLSRDDE